ncbi:uncharacterized protein LOC110640399 [Hevea brasiliensis]|uniref:uncharacterized protein LOC110640399 n=1 Tax=Hevea brasiliensis TaxID=3981 RepID=UPI0025CC1753|nr:uncharacterized protein LOC110640399 [Hevea brasiliensis]
MVQEIDSKVIEVLPIPYEDISQAATEASDKFVYKDSTVAYGQGEKPVLPDNLDRLDLYVRDVRKIIMHLQFWCQGEQLRKRIQLRKQQMGASCLKQSNEVRRLFSLIPFSLEDRYQILPKMIPWDFPSWLSELVEKEITILLCMMEESGVFTEVIEDKFDDKDMQNYFEKHIYEIDSIEAKKKAMLSKNCFDHDSILQTPQFHSFGEAARELLILKVMTECQEVLTRILALNFSLKMMTNFPPVIQPCKKADAHQLTCNFVPSQRNWKKAIIYVQKR